MTDRILILDFGSQVTQLIARRVRESGVYCEIFPFNVDPARIEAFDPTAIILSGGPASVTGSDTPRAPDEVFALAVPVLGICYGQQAICAQLGGEVEASDHQEFGRAFVELQDDCALTEGLWHQGEKHQVWMSHGLGLSDLRDQILERLDQKSSDEAPAEGASSDEAPEDRAIQLAIVGRPNVGKSTLVNRLLQEDRMLTGPEAGITRDSISVDWTYKGRRIRLVDTAGLRKRARVTDKLEKLSAGDTLRAVEYAHVVVLLLDAGMRLARRRT